MRRAIALAAILATSGSMSLIFGDPARATLHGAPVDAALHDVVAIAADDAWAVGTSGLASHWNGTSWASQHLGGLHSPELNGVAASSAEDVWVVGGVIVQDVFRGFATHWDGTRWRRAPVPGYPGEVILEDVAVRGAGSAYAVGRWISVTPGGRRGGAVIVRWNGGTWRRIRAPQKVARLDGVVHAGGGSYHAVGVSTGGDPLRIAIAPQGGMRVYPLPVPAGDRCAPRSMVSGATAIVGACRSVPGRRVSPYVVEIQGNGNFRVTDVPGTAALRGVDGLTAVWAVGRSASTGQAVILRRGHGGTWFKVSAPTSPRGTSLMDVSSRTFNDAWAVGWRRPGSHTLPLALRWDGANWSSVPVPQV